MRSGEGQPDPALNGLRQEVAEGLLFAHTLLSEGSKQSLEAASFLYGLIELLSEKGLISIKEIDERKQRVAERLVNRYKERGVGLVVQDPECDKYAFAGEATIDCENRVQFCKAACCRLPFALSKQDINEGVVRWDLSQPYMIARDRQGYCTHLDQNSCRCTVRNQRPVPCRGYDCRKDQTIWLDFDAKIINPDILRADWPRPSSSTQGSGHSS